MRIFLFLGAVCSVIGLSCATVNSTCPTKTCGSQDEVCENGYCKIKIECTCITNQTHTTTEATTAGVAAPVTSPQKNAKTSTKATAAKASTLAAAQVKTSATVPTPATVQASATVKTATTVKTAAPGKRKRRQAKPVITTMQPMRNTQECVENSRCSGLTDLRCQCKEGYANDDKGFCQKTKSSAPSLRLESFTYVMVTFFFYISL